jgi:hypothetical protein
VDLEVRGGDEFGLGPGAAIGVAEVRFDVAVYYSIRMSMSMSMSMLGVGC